MLTTYGVSANSSAARLSPTHVGPSRVVGPFRADANADQLSDEDIARVDVRTAPPRIIIRHKQLAEKFIKYWMLHLPDISEFPTIEPKATQFWLKTKRQTRIRPHRNLRGMAAKWTNEAVDYVMSFNKWCVQFQDASGRKHNLIPEFIVTMWLKYLTLMTGRPEAKMNSAQLVLKYMLISQTKVHQTWRNRLYRFSSGNTFSLITDDLSEFLETNGVILLRDVRKYTDMSYLQIHVHLFDVCRVVNITTRRTSI